MTAGNILRLFGFVLVLLASRLGWATDSNIGDTSATTSSHEILFCSTYTTPYTGCPAADLRNKADALHSPVAIYEYVRNNYDYALYHGAHSGSFNTFAGLRGNDVDLAATLIAMLRSQGVPARYVVGTVRIPIDQATNWLAAKNVNLAYGLLRDVGIQGVSYDSATMYMEHVWVEALVPYSDYRGTGNSGVNCVTTPAACNWVPLDPSFKQHKTRSSGLDPYSSLSFDYDGYYKAIINSDATKKDKHPLEIYQNQVQAWLQKNAQGKTLDDIPDYYDIVPEQDGLLPASLPYGLYGSAGSVRRYNSVADHDAAVAAGTEPSTKNWNKYVTVQIQIGGSTVPGDVTASLVDASQQKLTVSWDAVGSGYECTFRLDGASASTPVNSTGAATVNGVSMVPGAAFKALLTMDGTPAPDPFSDDYSITATYDGVIGGYYLVATGGETSNWGQVHQAANTLLTKSQQYPIVYNPADPGVNGQACDLTTHLNCTPYIDVNGNGWDTTDPKLLDSKSAMDDLTGGLLEVAARQYFTKVRERLAQLDAINRIRTPVLGFLGLVSSGNSVQYLDGTAFSVEPGGLLIDMKGMNLGGSWRIDQPDQNLADSDSQFELAGHIMSSLEHETWQELTGFDAISTVRGIQIAMANSASLQTPYRDNAGNDTFPQAYPGYGFSATVPAGFTPHSYSLFGQTYQSWSNPNTGAGFEALYANSTNIPTGDDRLNARVYSANNGIDGFYSLYAGLIQQVNAEQAAIGQLKTNVPFDFQGATFVGQDVVSYSVTSPDGFAAGSATRTAGDTYRFTVNETKQHADGTYAVNASIKLASQNNTITQTFDLGGSFNFNTDPTTSTTGFKVVAYSQPSSSQATFTVQQTASHSDGNWMVLVSAYYHLNGVYTYGTFTFTIPISGGRVITYSGALPAMSLDTSDIYQIQCQGGAGGAMATYTGVPSQLMTNVQACFNNVLAVNNLNSFAAFFNQPDSLIYRAVPTTTDARPASSVASVRDTLYQANTADTWKAFRSPSKESTGSSFAFVVDYIKETNSVTGHVKTATYQISNQQVGAAGGGYVTAMSPIVPADDYGGTSFGQPETISTLPIFDNWNWTDLNTVAQINNNLILTPSTTDPVSTVTGNNFHDETDFVIKGRAGLNYVFTRTYNSTPSAAKQDNVGLGNGWFHSYGMRLTSNDYGKCPNCTSAQSPENGNKKTSSITYTDERGGDHNYLVTEDSSHTVTPPTGEFDSLALDTPVTGQHTLTFRNGTQYIFETPTGTLATTPGVVARLKQIADPWGNQINLTYNANGQLATVADNLGIPGRTGLVFSYDANNHLQTIADWASSGRTWRYNVVNVGGTPASYHLASYTNALGQATSYGYATGTNNLTTVTKPLQRNGMPVQTTFSYYQNGKTFNYHDALGNTETLDYDLYRKGTRVTDPRGGVRDYEYDSAGAMTRLTEPDGAILLFDNDPVTGLRYTKTDGLGYKTQYSYKSDNSFGSGSDTFGNVTREQDAMNQRVDTTYGPYDQVATVKDKRGIVTTTTFYTGSGACVANGKPNTVTVSMLNGVSNVLLKSYCWNADGTLISQTDYLSPTDPTQTRVTTYTYDTAAHLNVQSAQVAGGSGWNVVSTNRRYTYDTLGRKWTETLSRRASPGNAGQVSLTVTNTYDALDRVVQVKDAVGNLVINNFDANGQLWKVTHQYKKTDGSFDIRDIVTRTYDAADRVLSEMDAMGGITQYSYDAAGNVASITDPENHTLTYGYDEMNRRTSVKDANGRTVSTSYDLAGHPVTVTNGANETTTTAYDKIGRPASITDAHGYLTTIGYDANNNRTCIIDANAQATPALRNSDGCTVSTQYDELSRPILVRDALNGTTQTTYDLLGNPLVQIDAEGRKYTWGYDGLGRLTSETDFMGKTTSYSLDEAGNPWQRINRLGEMTNTTFDNLNRPTRVVYVKDNNNFDQLTYDPAGNLSYVASLNYAAVPSISYTFGYDNLNRLQSKVDSRGRSLSFTFDKSSRIQTKTTYQGSTTTYTYDGAGTLVSLTNPDYLTVNYQYDDAGRLLSRTMSSGARSLYAYDNGGWLNSLSHTDASGATVSSQSYTRDRVGNITGINVTVGPEIGATTYTLDALYRLTGVDAPGTANDEAFTYDHVGNRLTATRGGATVGLNPPGSVTKYSIYTPATQTGAVSGYTPTYNNRLSQIRIGSLTGTLESSFNFDDEGRLLSQTGGTPRVLTWDAKGRMATLTQSGTTETYSYDPMDHRIGRSGGAAGNLAYYLEGEHLESVEQGGVLTEKYFRGSTIDELVAGYVSQSGKLTPYFFQHDQVMSVSAETKPNGGTQARFAYYAFGETQAATGSPVGRLGYTGRENDGATTTPAQTTMVGGATLMPNQSITSANGRYMLVYQGDGNLVIYRTDGSGATWSTVTAFTTPGVVAMQGDGNLVIYTSTPGQSVWSSGTWGNPGARLVLRDDGNLVIYSTSDSVLWESGSRQWVAQANDGLMYYRNRYYDPTLGRFISEDPKKAGRNWYAYANNNPANGNDPMGTDVVTSWVGNSVSANPRIVYTGPGANDANVVMADYSIATGLKGKNITAPIPYATGGAYSSYSLTTTVTSEISQDPGHIAALVASGYSLITLAPQFSAQTDPLSNKAMDDFGTVPFTSSGWYSKGSARTDLTGGVWNTAMPWADAHETLHIGGQPDEYQKDPYQPFAGWEGNIMGDGTQPIDARNVAGLINAGGGGDFGFDVHLNGRQMSPAVRYFPSSPSNSSVADAYSKP